MCKGAKEDDVVSTCFRMSRLWLAGYMVLMGWLRDANLAVAVAERDSRKDEAIVFIFIFATSGLLAWALLGPWLQKWLQVCLLYHVILVRWCMLTHSGCEGKTTVYSCCRA